MPALFSPFISGSYWNNNPKNCSWITKVCTSIACTTFSHPTAVFRLNDSRDFHLMANSYPTCLGLQSFPLLLIPYSSLLRARERITSHFRIPSSSHLEPIFNRKILNVGFATPAVLLLKMGSIWPKSGREFWEVILSRALIVEKMMQQVWTLDNTP